LIQFNNSVVLLPRMGKNMSSRKSSQKQKKNQQLPVKNSANPNIWVYGTHTVLALLANPKRHYYRVVTCDQSLAEYINNSMSLIPEVAIEKVTRDFINKILPEGAAHQGIAVLAAPLSDVSLEEICEQAKSESINLLILDQVTDPHNIGAIVRSAAAFNAKAIIVQDRHTPPITGVIAKSASGGLEHCPIIRVKNLVRAMETLKKNGIWCIGLDSEAAKNIKDLSMDNPKALVFGSEGRGLRRLTRLACDEITKISSSGFLKSLNVSNAAAIALYEITRKD